MEFGYPAATRAADPMAEPEAKEEAMSAYPATQTQPSPVNPGLGSYRAACKSSSKASDLESDFVSCS